MMDKQDVGHRENELKLSGSLNNQLKYVGDTVEGVLSKLCTSLDLLGIQHDPPKKISQEDTYYDTRQRLLEKSGCSLRIREIGTEKILTAKKPSQVLAGALQRTEYEQPLPAAGQAMDHVKSYFHQHFPEHAEESLDEILQVRNVRYEIKISTSCANSYTLCFDKYEYYCRSTGAGSDPFYEIEIEQIGTSSIERDPDIQKLSRLLTDLMGFQIERRNKYKKGIAWLKDEAAFENRIFILFDFVSYSQAPSSIQRQLIRDFTNLIRPKLEEYIPDCIKIPIGDGMILGCPPDVRVIAFLDSLFSALHQHNDNVQRERALHIRTALHYGPIYKYTDINGDLNYAGSGINLVARIASQTGSGQVLISRDCAQYLLDSGRIKEQYLSETKSITVKHGVLLSVLNYCDRNSKIGRPDSME